MEPGATSRRSRASSSRPAEVRPARAITARGGNRYTGAVIAIRWALVLGICAFAAGFVGPMVLDPEANIGPLVGILITGPGGAAAGLLLGAVASLLPLTVTQRSRALAATCVVATLGILYALLPKPAVRGYVIDATVESCAKPVERVEESLATWDDALKRVTWARPPAGWRDTAQQNAERDPGVVLTMRVHRKLPILRHRRPWDKGATSAGQWIDAEESHAYYDASRGAECTGYVGRPRALYWPAIDPDADPTQPSRQWPPTDTLGFLRLQALGPVPAEYRRFVQ